MSDMYAEKSEEASGDVLSQLEGMERSVERLCKTASLLEGRLSLVTTPHEDVPSVETVSNDALVPLAARLREINIQLSRTERNLGDLVHRIKI